jgi:Lon protease (S16) C-terminal proteolytic domain
MKLTRVLGILLLLSLCLNLYLAYLVFFTAQGSGADFTDLSNRLDLVTSENAKLSLELDRNNLTLAALENQIGLYRHQLQQLTGLVNSSPGGPVGSAVLQGPAVLQQVRYSGNNPYGAAQVTQTGVLLNISAEVKPGEGRVLVDTMPLMGVVFQDAANTAVLVAENRTGVSLAGSDVIFSIRAPGQVPAVDGPSAGALMTLLAISAIDGKPLREDLTLTGTIDENGNVGAIGGIPEKAQAAKDAGKSLLLLPRENAQLVQYTQQTRQYYGFNVIRQTPTTVDAKTYVESTIGIPVQYVDTIDDVVKIATVAG